MKKLTLSLIIKKHLYVLKFQTLLFLMLFFAVSSAFGQESINATGGEGDGIEGNVSYTVGQALYTSHNDSSHMISSGVQQAYEISVVLGFEEIKEYSIDCSVFPNPTSDFIILHIQKCNPECMVYQLYNITGKLISQEPIAGNQQTIPLKDLAKATYILKVLEDQKILRTFKLIKN